MDNKIEKKPLPKCRYGEKCYRVNPEHLAKFSHPITNAAKMKRKQLDDEDTEGPSQKKHHSLSPETLTLNNNSESEDAEQNSSDSDEEIPFTNSPETPAESILQKYLVEMPPDFYSFWEFCKSINAKQPECALLLHLGLRLVGPYDILAGLCKNTPKLASYFLVKDRYFYDPPEYQTVIQGDSSSQHHIGYFRDSPDELPVFVAENEAKINGIITPVGDNIFAAVNCFLKRKLSDSASEPLKKLQNSLKKFAKEQKLSLEENTSKMKARAKKVNAKCFHGAGIVVPFDEKLEIGYRPLPETDRNIKKILQKIADAKTEKEKNSRFEDLQKLITFVQFANDECDYGMGLELALDLFTFGHATFHPVVLNMLPLAYELLGRPQFAKIVKAHLKNRVQTIS